MGTKGTKLRLASGLEAEEILYSQGNLSIGLMNAPVYNNKITIKRQF